MEKSTVMEILQRPFPAEDIEWRIAQCGMKKGGGVWAKVLAYITARAVHERLDEAFGLFGWKTEFRELTVSETYESDLPETPEKKRGRSVHSTTGVICRISFLNPETGEWCWRENGAPQTDYEPFKGGISGSEKRAFAEMGGGRYLYKLKDNWAIIGTKKSDVTPYYQPAKTGHGAHAAFWWGPPQLPAFALPSGVGRRPKTSPTPEQEEGRAEEPEIDGPVEESVEEPNPFKEGSIVAYPNIKLPPAGTQGINKVKELIGMAQILGWSEEKFGVWYKEIIRKDLAEVNSAQATLLLQKMKKIAEEANQ